MFVGSVMRRAVFTVRPETSLRDVASLLVEHGISGVPVVDDAGSVVGVVSEADFVLRERGAPEGRSRLLGRLFGSDRGLSPEELAKIHATTAGEAMSSPAIVVESSTSLHEAARIMIERAVNRLPVVEGGRLVGIVSRADLVRAFVRTDDELRGAIVGEVIRRAMGLDDRQLDVRVVEGRVTIAGTVEKRSDGPILERLVERVPGVLSVDMQVGWQLDDSDVQAPERDLVYPPYGPR